MTRAGRHPSIHSLKNASFAARTGATRGWRTRAKLAVRSVPSANGAHGKADPLALGLFARGTHDLVEIPECVVHHPRINQAARYVAASWPKLSTAWEGLSEARDLKEKKAVAAAAWKNRREYRAGPAHDVHLTATLHAGHAVRGPEQRDQSGEVDVPDPLAFWFGLGIEVNKRHIVTAVHPGGAAADEGTLRVGDRLTSVNGERLEAGGRTLRQLLAALFIVDGEPVTLVGVRPIESHVDAMLEEARRPPPPKADAGIALRRPNWDRRHPSSSGYRGPTRSAAEMLHKPRAWDSQMFALRDWIGYHWSQRS